jgi:hypothetical protein
MYTENNKKKIGWAIGFVFTAMLVLATATGALADFTRKDVEFKAEDGVVLRGWLYLPKQEKGPAPAIVMAHGFSAVKEMWLDKYAEVFASAGMAALVYDHRNFGASDGMPRQEIDPWAQIRDYRTAITYVRTLPEINRELIGIWGTSYSGGEVLVVGAIDRRVKAVVAQAPATKLFEAMQRTVGEAFFPGLLAALDAEREDRFKGKPPAMIPVVTKDPTVPAVLPQAESWEWFTKTAQLRAPSWRNEVTLRTINMNLEFVPWAFVDRISPTPLLMIVPSHDSLLPTSQTLETYQRALEPKKLIIVQGGHFAAYIEQFEKTSSAARDWFAAHLKP